MQDIGTYPAAQRISITSASYKDIRPLAGKGPTPTNTPPTAGPMMTG